MDVETESLPIINFCKPTTSQEAILSNLPFARESENFVNSSQAHSSSLEPTPSEPTRIVMSSLPGSSGSVNEHTVEEDDQNPNEGMTTATTTEGSVKVRISDSGQLAVIGVDVTIGGLVRKVDASNGNHELRKKCERVDVRITRRNVVGEKCKLRSDARGSEKVDVIMKDAEIPKDIHIDECVRSNGKRIKEIEEFRYTGDDNTRLERRTGGPAGVSGRRRQLPPSFKGKEKEVVGNSEKKRGFLDLLNELKSVFEDTEDECDEVDILETAKQCGWTFPTVRWWPPDGEDWYHGLP